MKRITVLAGLLLFANGQPNLCGGTVDLQGTLVSGIAVHDASALGGRTRVPAPGVQIYCAWGKYDGVIFECHDIWGTDCTSGFAAPGEPVGLFHFHHPDALNPSPGISLMYQLDERNPCSNPATPPGRFFSQFFTPQMVGQGHSVKAEFLLHPTAQGFKSTAKAADQIAQIVAVHYLTFHFSLGEGARERTEPSVRNDIAKEVAIILDSLKDKENPKEAMADIKKQLANVEVKYAENIVKVIDWLPSGDDFWGRIEGAWAKETAYWSNMHSVPDPSR